jgi:polysaccharide biosynthesis protein PslH
VSRPLSAGLVERLAADHAADPFTTVLAVSFRVAHLGLSLADRLDVPLVIRPHNIESSYFAELSRSVGPLRSLPYRAEAWKLRRAEAVVHRDPRVALFADISDADAARRARLTKTPVDHVPPFLAPRPVPAPTARRPGGRPVVLFLGSLDNANNEVGIRWFVDECWPALRSQAELHVVGRRGAPALIAHLVAAGARVTVDAPDVAPVLAAADVFVNPVRGGAGINIKMVDALAAALPVVTTTVGARGLHWRPDEHLVVADGPVAFRSAVADLLADAERRAVLGSAGRRFVVEELDGVRRITQLLGAVPRTCR